MYCIKVDPGRERIKVRQVSCGFIPKYMHAEGNGKPEEKRFVVPGYVFTLQYAPGAVKVPDEEWAVIEAVSDSHLSSVDRESRTITEGPLKAIADSVAVIEAERVKVVARILGERRTYWLAVETCDPAAETAEEAADSPEGMAEGAGNAEEALTAENELGAEKAEFSEKKGKERKTAASHSKYDFTDEQKARMLARAEEVGNRQAAEEFSVPWQVIAQIKRRERERNGGTYESEAPKAETGRKAGRPKKADAAPKAAVALPAEPDDIESLKAENALLREKIAKLEEKAASLKKAILEIM